MADRYPGDPGDPEEVIRPASLGEDGDQGGPAEEILMGAETEPSWPPRLAALAGLVLYLTLPDTYAPGPRWLPTVLVGALAAPLVIANPVRLTRHSGGWRVVSLALVAVVNLFNMVAVGALVHDLLHHSKTAGNTLIVSAIQIWLTNVVVYSLWFWELDQGGPLTRRLSDGRSAGFLFPQQASPDHSPRGWVPRFVDYLYLAFTNATAFSPTDAMPLRPWAKMLMMAEASVSLLTVAVVASRAVNILT